jgi:hypothetical protein
VLRAAALVATASLLACASASAATPAQMLAAKLKADMQSYYTKTQPGLKLTRVTCTIAKPGTSARCQARFAVPKQRAVGLFVLAIKIDTATGGVTTKTVSATCKDAKTGAKLSCF